MTDVTTTEFLKIRFKELVDTPKTDDLRTKLVKFGHPEYDPMLQCVEIDYMDKTCLCDLGELHATEVCHNPIYSDMIVTRTKYICLELLSQLMAANITVTTDNIEVIMLRMTRVVKQDSSINRNRYQEIGSQISNTTLFVAACLMRQQHMWGQHIRSPPFSKSEN